MAAAHASGQLPTPHDSASPDTADPSGIPHDVPAAFVAGALIGVATDWLRRGCPGTPTEIASRSPVPATTPCSIQR
ncbi:TetR-like C-terminal domain-containing protein [Streptomyces bicolor]|uniref:TetR-like C-terminal domain-containing protein n=1 Tax=Streptomyces bicolor TaxID=66874 RepID=UPI0004E1537A|nr:TetR-like C-terminal domain-containing protein [Streptomyces bicolor]